MALGRSGAYVYAAQCDAARLVGRKDAASNCAKAIAIDPKSRRALWANGRLALTERRYTDAIANFNAYVTQDPQRSDFGYYWRGVAYNRVGKYAFALDDIQKFLTRTPQDADALRERAIARYGMGDKVAALQDLDAASREYRKKGDLQAADGVSAIRRALETGTAIPLQ
ncbi:MAG: hypothetical protein JOZ24_09875 [Candidatus Eremiobacteraeota bacterium]|nr:hypothetical protein [Candidatus Eremiobacteraeota bacterium]